MDNYSLQLNHTFQALADPTRRSVLRELGKGAATVGDLAKPFDMALPSFMKHIHLLERCGLIRTQKAGRVRTCTIVPESFVVIERWLADQHALWEARTDRLEQFVIATQQQETAP
jgi:DNA-binding transcriptional ArsR family regulator